MLKRETQDGTNVVPPLVVDTLGVPPAGYPPRTGTRQILEVKVPKLRHVEEGNTGWHISRARTRDRVT